MNKSVMRLLAFPLFIGVFYSCQSKKTGKGPDSVSPAIIKAMDTVSTAMDTVSTAMDTATVAEEESPLVDSNFKNFPIDFSNDSGHYPASILTTGQFHEDEVSREDLKRTWFGIFRNNGGYYLDSATIRTKRVEDPVLDENGSKTGWEINTTNADTSILLIAGIDGLSKKAIVPAQLSKNQLLPGEKVSFTYNGIVYTLFATGGMKKTSPKSEAYVINYELFLKATINGVERRQLLMSAAALDDAMAEILFAGDIDGDTIPDLIINTSYHYNAEVPTLYLSKPAGAQLLKVMGLHVSVGC
ncbi:MULTISPECIES: hypothetical protein [Niastella]|uniref:Lipoprotein n=1 Tax=Niastella soli TaxID=2821487 RepID=A0ABS3Z1G7_9BACT|nr:hypothetical protein [Niastella soli]MBO9204004.1 hypothetical protein [Niastella soli]